MYMNKTCTKCKIEKSTNDFGIARREKDGLQSVCKLCAKEYRDKHKEKTKKYNEKYRIENKERMKELCAQNYIRNQEKFIEEARERYKENKEDLLLKAKQYYIDNKETIAAKKKIYVRNRLKTDSFYKFKNNIRTLIKSSFRLSGIKKNSKCRKILGCSFEEFRDHIEKQFDENMNWNNSGSYWHLDHIKPISLAKTKKEVIELNHYTNFQPLYWKDNLSKGNKYNE